MARSRPPATRRRENGSGDLGFEATLWQAADKLRGNLDAAEYKHVVLGLIFLKYISDAFDEARVEVAADPDGDPEDRDEYASRNVFWVPLPARWSFLQAKAKDPDVGKLLDDAMEAIEHDNARLKGVLPKDYARPALDKRRLGELIDLIGTIGLGDAENRSKDIIGRVYEYFLGQFASAEGKKGGEFYTPRSVVRLLVEMLAPRPGSRIYDPCCGSGGMFVQSERFIEDHGGRMGDISIFGQELNWTTWRLCQMNLAIRGIEARIEQGDTLHADKLPDLRADYVLANPPFNVSDWGGDQLRDDQRWHLGVPPVGNANFAWVQHFVHHLSPNGLAGFVLSNGALSANQDRAEGLIRRSLIEADLVDCVVSLPPQLFYSTQIAVSLWFLARNKSDPKLRDRRGEVLFIYAAGLGHMVDRTHRDLGDREIERIAQTYRAWRGDAGTADYADEPGFSGAVSLQEVSTHNWAVVPGRYVGFAPREPLAVMLDAVREELGDIESRILAIQTRADESRRVIRGLLDG
jgi:type I restriction enzyme M protein